MPVVKDLKIAYGEKANKRARLYLMSRNKTTKESKSRERHVKKILADEKPPHVNKTLKTLTKPFKHH